MKEVSEIQDHLKDNLYVIFVGFNPSLKSGELGHHYANPNNRFWKILYESKLTPRLYKPTEDYKLLELGYGLTNIVARPTKAADEITKEEYAKGREILRKQIEKYKPAIVCYVGKGVYKEYSLKKQIPWGRQQEPIVEETIDFVAPSSSGLVRMKMEDIVKIYRELTDLVESIKNK